MVPVDRTLISIGYKYMRGRFYLLLLRTTQGAQRPVLPIYLSILTNLLMLPFALLFVPLLCQFYFLPLMRLTPTTNQENLIRRSEKWWVTQCGLAAVMYDNFLWEITITNFWKLFRYIRVKRETAMKN